MTPVSAAASTGVTMPTAVTAAAIAMQNLRYFASIVPHRPSRPLGRILNV